MSKIEQGTADVLRVMYPVKSNPEMTDTILVGEPATGTVFCTTAGNIKDLYAGAVTAGDDGFVTGGDVSAALDGKINKEEGKGLSSNDYTDAEKAKLAGIPVLDYTSLEEQIVPGEFWDGKQVHLRTFKGNLPTTPLEGEWLLPLTQGLQVIPVQAWGWVSQENWGDPYLVPNSKVDIISKGWYGLSIMFDSILVGRAYHITAKYIKA